MPAAGGKIALGFQFSGSQSAKISGCNGHLSFLVSGFFIPPRDGGDRGDCLGFHRSREGSKRATRSKWPTGNAERGHRNGNGGLCRSRNLGTRLEFWPLAIEELGENFNDSIFSFTWI